MRTENILCRTWLPACFLVAISVPATVYHVDNRNGNDAAAGTAEAPFKTIEKGLAVLHGGDELHLAPNPEPYFESLVLRDKRYSGTLEQSTLIDGHGAVLSGLRHCPADQWKNEGGGLFSTKLQNNAWVMDAQGYWSGFPIVFIDGQPLDFVAKKQDLQENTYFLHKEAVDRGPLHNTLYVKLAAGQTPSEVNIQLPLAEGVGTVGVSHVLIRNLTSTYTSSDGFFTCWGTGIEFNTVFAHKNMDQGISNHSAQVVVKHSTFSGNAGCGIVDINMNEQTPCRVDYISCLVEGDVCRGGVEFHGGFFSMTACIIKGNPKKAIEVNKGATVTLENCLLVDDGQGAHGIQFGGQKLEILNCTLAGFATGLTTSIWREHAELVIRNSAFLNCKMNYRLNKPAKEGLKLEVISDYNFFEPAPFDSLGKLYAAKDWDVFVQETGLEQHSIIERHDGELPPMQLPGLAGKGKDGSGIGACLDPQEAGRRTGSPFGSGPAIGD
jgi:hypothetical protein